MASARDIYDSMCAGKAVTVVCLSQESCSGLVLRLNLLHVSRQDRKIMVHYDVVAERASFWLEPALQQQWDIVATQDAPRQ